MSHAPAAIPAEDLQSLVVRFRTTKHDINNVFAVLLALAELSERNPSNYERLAKAVLERCPKVVQELQEFQDALQAPLEKTAPGV